MTIKGRPRGFDRSETLDLALMAFWRNGYEATSMADLVSAMGINSPSIYAAYGSKEELFCEAVQRYRTHHAAEVLNALNGASDAASGIAAMFEAAIQLFTRSGYPRGCFIVVAAGGNAPATAEVQTELARMRLERSNDVAARIERDLAEERLPPQYPTRVLADMYVAILQGISVAARDGMYRSRLSGLYKPALTLLKQTT